MAIHARRGPWLRALLGIATFPFIYYSLVLVSASRFFRQRRLAATADSFTPPVSNLKPVRGVDPDAYNNFASFCTQDYPTYEVLFCVDGPNDPVVPLLQQLQREFPKAHVRIIFGSGRIATNDKVAKLARMVSEAAFEHLVISDSDVRVQPDYLRAIIGPLQDRRVGATTCFYLSENGGVIDRLQSIGMISDFYASLLVARQLDGVKFALGPTIGTTRHHLAEFGGYESIENKPADDLWVGRLIAERGHRVELLNYTVDTVPDFGSLADLVHKRMRWLVVQRHMRPWGHFGSIFTHGFAWTLLAITLSPSAIVSLAYGATYLAFRATIMWTVGDWGLKQRTGLRNLPLVVAWDALSFGMWLASFTRSTIRWRNADYQIREGKLVPLPSSTIAKT